MPQPIIPEIDINQYYLMNMTNMQMAQQQAPPPPPPPPPPAPKKEAVQPKVEQEPCESLEMPIMQGGCNQPMYDYGNMECYTPQMMQNYPCYPPCPPQMYPSYDQSYPTQVSPALQQPYGGGYGLESSSHQCTCSMLNNMDSILSPNIIMEHMMNHHPHLCHLLSITTIWSEELINNRIMLK